MEDSFAKVEELAEHVKEYVNNRVTWVKLNIAEKSSKLLATIIAMAVVALVFLLVVVFASIALAYVLSTLTGALYLGFLIVAGIYLILGLVVWFMREKILQLPIMNSMLNQLFKEDESDSKN